MMRRRRMMMTMVMMIVDGLNAEIILSFVLFVPHSFDSLLKITTYLNSYILYYTDRELLTAQNVHLY